MDATDWVWVAVIIVNLITIIFQIATAVAVGRSKKYTQQDAKRRAAQSKKE